MGDNQINFICKTTPPPPFCRHLQIDRFAGGLSSRIMLAAVDFLLHPDGDGA
jgi:hypothetical protein